MVFRQQCADRLTRPIPNAGRVREAGRSRILAAGVEEFKGLRINFAHFGGFDKAIIEGGSMLALPKTCEWTIGGMAKAMPIKSSRT